MEETNLYRACIQVVEVMEQGLPWHEAAKRAGLEISQSTAYRLRQRMRKAGEQALREGRHGHPIKLRGEVRKVLEEICRQALTRQATKSKRSSPSVFPFKSV
jgi:transposase